MRDRFLRFFTVAALLAAGQLEGLAQGRPGSPFGGAPASRPDLANPIQTAPLPVPSAMERPSGVVDPNRSLQPGDELTFSIVEDKMQPVPLIVSHTGEIEVDPLPRAVKVTGMTANQAEAMLKRLLEKDYYYTASVRLVLQRINQRATMGYIYLDGAVSRIGAMPIYQETPMKLSEAVSMAGGFAQFADDRKVKLTRVNPGGGSQVQVVDVKKIIQGGQSDLDVTLKAGDRIYVPKRFINY